MAREEVKNGREDMRIDAIETDQKPIGEIPVGFNSNYLKVYYGKFFTYADMQKWMSYGNDGKHPGCDQSYFGRSIYLRFQSFNSVTELESSIKEKCPVKIDIGPVYSVDVSKHMNHLLKAPFCIHPKTGRVCVPIDPKNCEEFDSSVVPTLSMLLHFHIGSQIPTTSLLADGVGEAAQIYCEPVRLGAGMKVLDIGGGLGIDYDCSKSQDSDISVSYSLQEYASTVVQTVQFVCDRKGVKHPVLCSESGRALVSHHSILVFEVVSASSRKSSQEILSLGAQYFMERYEIVVFYVMFSEFQLSDLVIVTYSINLYMYVHSRQKTGEFFMRWPFSQSTPYDIL